MRNKTIKSWNNNFVVYSLSIPSPLYFLPTDNLHDYCTDEHWSDFPGHKTISAEKSLQIRNPLIFNFNTNSSNRFVSYCLIRLIATEGKRIYAVGTSSGEYFFHCFSLISKKLSINLIENWLIVRKMFFS